MPNIKPDIKDETLGSPMEQAIKSAISSIAIASMPTMITGVGRLVNIGNYENVSIFSAITIPMGNIPLDDYEKLQEIANEAAAVGFGIVSEETGSRYAIIKNIQKQKNGRPEGTT